MLSTEVRELMVKAYEKSHNATEVARNFSVSRGTTRATILSSIRLNGETAYTTYQGGTTCERFTDYLKNVLAPTLHESDIVVMDNMRTHHSKAVKKLLRNLKSRLFFCRLTVPVLILSRRCGLR